MPVLVLMFGVWGGGAAGADVPELVLVIAEVGLSDGGASVRTDVGEGADSGAAEAPDGAPDIFTSLKLAQAAMALGYGEVRVLAKFGLGRFRRCQK